MYIHGEHTTFVNAKDIRDNYLEFKGKTTKIIAKVNGVSLRCFLLKLETHGHEDMTVRIPKRDYDRLQEVSYWHNRIDVRVVIEGIPYFCAHREQVCLKQCKILDIYGI